jgi:hypothetical protein
MNANSTTVFTLTFNQTSYKTTFAGNTNFALVFTNPNNKLNEILGFTGTTPTSYVNANSYTTENVCNMQLPISRINICSDALTSYGQRVITSNYFDNSNLICRIENSIFKPWETINYSNDDKGKMVYKNNIIQNINTIDIRILDFFNREIKFNGGDKNVSINIEFYLSI